MSADDTAATTGGVLLDLDGTLVDSVFLHVTCWAWAFARFDLHPPMWRIHHGIGMPGDRLVPWVLGTPTDLTGQLKETHEQRFLDQADDLQPTRGARELLRDLRGRDVPFCVVTSASDAMLERLLQGLGEPQESLPILTGDDTEAVKPAPGPLLAAAQRLDVAPSLCTMVGDSPWDAEAALRAGMRALCVRTGGFGVEELRLAGSQAVVDDTAELVGRL